MFVKHRSKFTVAIIVMCSFLMSLFQNCGSAVPKSYSKEDDDDGNNTPKALDTEGPKITLFEKPAQLTKNSKAIFQLLVSDDRSGVATIEQSLDGAAWKVTTSMLVFDKLAAGDHELKVKAKDKSSNESKVVVYKWRIDDVVPVIEVLSRPQLLSHYKQFSSTNPMTITFNASDDRSIASTVCTVNGVQKDCSSKKFSEPVALGAHSATITVTDTAGNITKSDIDWTVAESAGQVVPPEIVKFPDSNSRADTITIRFKGIPLASLPSGSYYRCYIDGVKQSDSLCAVNTDNIFGGITQRIDGGVLKPHEFVVKLKHGTKSEVNTKRSWTTDTTSPTLALAKGPKAFEMQPDVKFKFTTTDNAGGSNVVLICTFDGTKLSSCPPNVEFSVSSMSGDHTMTVDAHDLAGNFIVAAQRLELKWTNPSCSAGDLALRWPMNGGDSEDWAVSKFIDRDKRTGHTMDWGDAVGAQARTDDEEGAVTIYPGDHKSIYNINESGVVDKVNRPQRAAVYAMASGVVDNNVVFNKKDRSLTNSQTGCGTNQVHIKHANGFTTEYLYLAENSIPSNISKGASVSKGQLIGYVGSGCEVRPLLMVKVKNCQSQREDPLRMGATANIKHGGLPQLFNVVVHNMPFANSGSGLIKMLNQTDVNTAKTPASADDDGVILSGFASRLTKHEHLYVKLSASGKTSIYESINVASSLGMHFYKKFVLRPATWTLEIYHSKGDDCKGNRWKDNSKCVLHTQSVKVIN